MSDILSTFFSFFLGRSILARLRADRFNQNAVSGRNAATTPETYLSRLLVLALTLVFSGSSLAEKSSFLDVKIATDNYPPYTSQANGGSGVVADIVSTAFAVQGIRVKYVFSSWKRSELLVSEGKVLGAIPYFINDERQQYYDFSAPLLKGHTYFYYNQDKFPEGFDWETLNDFKPYTIGSVPGYWYIPKFRFNDLTLDLVDTERQNFEKLVHQRIDFTIAGQVRAEFALQNLPPQLRHKIHRTDRAESHNHYHAIISRKHPHAKAYNRQLAEGLRKIILSGEYLSILNKHKLSENVAVELSTLNF